MLDQGSRIKDLMKQISTSVYKKYAKEVLPQISKEFKVKNFYALPQIEKIVVNMGLKHARDDKSVLEEAVIELAAITGQKPSVTRAKKSISNFSLREGNPIGCKVTLRGKMMYEFLERLLRVVIPRIRDFSGLKRSFDRFGNLTIGIEDESIFPEFEVDKIKTTKGMNITIVTDKQDKEKSVKLFELLGFPFKKQ